MPFNFIEQALEQQKQQARYRQRFCLRNGNKGSDVNTDNQLTLNNDTLSQSSNSQIVVDGKSYINFSSNDYLGLNHHPDINKAMQEGVERFGVSACSSSLVTGYHYAHQALEETICEWLNKPRCLLFSSGFAANVALLQTLGQKDGHLWLDKLSHASMIDGAFSSKAKVKRFAHNNINQLNQWLDHTPASNHLIASEGIFSMDGDQANVAALAKTAKQHNAWLYLDDAHSIGVIGDKGQGSCSIADVDITMATFGKSIATSGAFLTCEASLHEYMINFCRHYIYSTAISPALAWATKRSIELIQQEHWRREKIQQLSELFINKLDNNIEIIPSQSSIHAIIIGDETKTLAVSDKLKKQDLWVTAIRPPTVANNTSRLRVTICANHNNNEIIKLAQEINKALIDDQ